MGKNRKCRWREGCGTILSRYNKTDLCSVHRGLETERLIQESTEEETRETGIENVAITISNEAKTVAGESIVDKILQLICISYNVTMDELLGRHRYPRVAFPRQVAAYLLRIDTKRSFPNIAADLRRKNHTTIIYACEKIRKLTDKNQKVRKDIETIRAQYKSPA